MSYQAAKTIRTEMETQCAQLSGEELMFAQVMLRRFNERVARMFRAEMLVERPIRLAA